MSEEVNFTFQLPESFIEPFKTRKPPFGFPDAAGNSVGELVFARTYSRRKEDGTKEQWWEVCKRITEGTFTIQKNYCLENRMPWSGPKALATAKDFYERLFELKWSPPGRGLFSQGTVNTINRRTSNSLQNCAVISTYDMPKHNPAKCYVWLMEASMNGIGVGFDTRGEELGIEVRSPRSYEEETFVIPDTREGWAESVGMVINAYLADKPLPKFDYSEIRPYGAPIKTFGGTASGPKPLIDLHQKLGETFKSRLGDTVDSRLIVDICNLIGVAVVSGNVRRSAELAMGRIDDTDFINLKNPAEFPDRQSHAFMSNNSVNASVGDDLSHIVDGIKLGGEPGVIWMDMARKYGRLKDPADNKDYRVAAFNPCAEQPLEPYECCTLCDVYLHNAESLEDFKKTLKVAFLYGKTVTLVQTDWPETNQVMQRNRRIGTSLSGVADFVDNYGRPKLRTWLDEGFDEIKRLDKVYSEWLCVRESIRTTTIKPGGTTGVVAGTSPGAHWTPGGKFFIRRVTFDKGDPIVESLRKAGYKVEESFYTPETSVVVEFPIKSKARRSESEVSIYEKISLAADLQYWWSDNAVSVTVSFDPEKEADDIGTVLHMYEGQLKTVSFLPMGGAYPQMPYEPITEDEYEERRVQILPVDMAPIYGLESDDAIGESFCNTDSCLVEIPEDSE